MNEIDETKELATEIADLVDGAWITVFGARIAQLCAATLRMIDALEQARAELAELKSAQYQPFEKIMSMEEWRSLSAQSRHNCNVLGLKVEELEKSNMAEQVMIAALQADLDTAGQDWIPVETRLPDVGKWVLVLYPDGEARSAKRDRGNSNSVLWFIVYETTAHGGREYFRNNPTHWMPLPKRIEHA